MPEGWILRARRVDTKSQKGGYLELEGWILRARRVDTKSPKDGY